MPHCVSNERVEELIKLTQNPLPEGDHVSADQVKDFHAVLRELRRIRREMRKGKIAHMKTTMPTPTLGDTRR